MILQALTQYYEDLLALGKIERPGWSKSKVSYGLVLNDEGQLTQLLQMCRRDRAGTHRNPMSVAGLHAQ